MGAVPRSADDDVCDEGDSDDDDKDDPCYNNTGAVLRLALPFSSTQRSTLWTWNFTSKKPTSTMRGRHMRMNSDDYEVMMF